MTLVLAETKSLLKLEMQVPALRVELSVRVLPPNFDYANMF